MKPGLKLVSGGAEFFLFSRHGTAAWFCLFEGDRETKRIALIKSGDHFCGFIKDLKIGDTYGLRVDGPWQPDAGHLFDVHKLLVDPMATKIDRPFEYVAALGQRGVETSHLVPKGIVEEEKADVPLHKVRRPLFIYELNVKAFTKLYDKVHPAKRGTILALTEPAIISHLAALGVDTVELMPIHAWIDERHLHALGLHNAWGYNSVQFMALDPKLAPGGWADLRLTIETLHAHNIQVVLDVVYNHSGESDVFGPTLSFRGLDNLSYYAQSNGKLHNDAGCGNALDLNNPPVMDMVLQSLRQLVLKTGLDGFRFDLATSLGHKATGFDPEAPLLNAIMADAVLGDRILIAEPWDVGLGGYQLGQFPASWLEWSDRYRDDVRRFWRGDDWSANNLATRICGSSDVFGDRKPSASVNFIAAHDGFTLRDLTQFSAKQNFANGEENRDGNSSEVIWRGGDVRALLATLFLSRGTQMLTAGDEFGRSQDGNNNAYAQDNETTWLNWAKRDKGLIHFVQTLVKLRANLAEWFADEFVTGKTATWFGVTGAALDWQIPQNRFVVFVQKRGKKQLAIAFNASAEAMKFKIAGDWKRLFCSAAGDDCPKYSVSVFLKEI